MNLGLSLVKLRRRQRNGLSMKYSKAKKHRLWILKAREKRKEEKNKVMSYRSKIQVERKQERDWLRHNLKSEWWRRGNIQKEVRERRDERKSRNRSSLSCSAALLESIQYCVYSFEIDRQSLIHMIRQVTLNFTCCAEKMKQYATAHMHIVHIRTHKSSLHLPNPNELLIVRYSSFLALVTHTQTHTLLHSVQTVKLRKDQANQWQHLHSQPIPRL